VAYEATPKATAYADLTYQDNDRATLQHTAFYGVTPKATAYADLSYQDNARAIAQNTALYQAKPKATAYVDLSYQDNAKAGAWMVSPYTVTLKVAGWHSAPSIFPTPVEAHLYSAYALQTHNPAGAWNAIRYNIGNSPIATGDAAVVLHAGAVSMRLSDAYVSASLTDSGYTFEASILDASMLGILVERSEIVVDFAGEAYTLFVATRSLNRSSPESVEAKITALSPVHLKALPYSSVKANP